MVSPIMGRRNSGWQSYGCDEDESTKMMLLGVAVSHCRLDCLGQRSENFCRVQRSKFPAHNSLESCNGRKTKSVREVAPFLLPAEVFAASHCARTHWSAVFMGNATKGEYDLYTAITFFLVGVGVGSVLALVFNPRHQVALGAINSSRRAA